MNPKKAINAYIIKGKIIFTSLRSKNSPRRWRSRINALGFAMVKVCKAIGESRKIIVTMKLSTKDHFEKGIDLYQNKTFAEASVEFSKVLESHPEDKAAQIYLERCAHLIMDGVSAGWTAVEAF